MENYVLFLVSVLVLSYAADKEEVSGVIIHFYDIKLVFDGFLA